VIVSPKAELLHMNIYSWFPPVADAIAVPSHTPLQEAADPDTDATTWVGSPIVCEDVSIHPLPSVIVTVYVPEHKPVAVSFVCAEGSFHKYVNGATPPAGMV
jgi:hypothetical protein